MKNTQWNFHSGFPSRLIVREWRESVVGPDEIGTSVGKMRAGGVGTVAGKWGKIVRNVEELARAREGNARGGSERSLFFRDEGKLGGFAGGGARKVRFRG